ncbi:putative nuclease HARBI1 [Vigna radiata var. radiata]|uniref:Nuclease HARBI1 n=1 Tax=Vigna radiata var. radiata TaxID=3916 RepID=A0A3Q0EKW5_VIGRR|nr:putative nuclease HARBI1 [Vigna radiata var. radiata]
MEEELDLSSLEAEDIDDDVLGVDFNIISIIRRHLEITTALAAVTMLCIVAHALSILEMYWSDSTSVSISLPERDRRREKLMSYLVHTNRSRDIIRMGPEAFIKLCERVRSTGLVKDAIRSTVEQQVAQFLHIIGHNVKNRSVGFFFHRSGSTVSRHFHNVLGAVISLESEFLIQPSGNEVQPYIYNNNRFYPYFKDCLGAIDGTHVRVKVGRSDAPRFRGRKDWPTQNVFAACDFDMKFTYVLAGWEGTALDSRILKNALDRDDLLVIPQGKYYLGDAGFMLKSTVLTPYRGVRYHLKEYTRRGPQNARELFNHRHSSARNVIERTFGVLKKRFPIIASGTEPHYDLETMTEIILACCILHNFLRSVDHDDSLLDEVDNEINEREEHNVSSSQVREEDHRMGTCIRDAIADHMWRDYQNS